MVTWLRPLAAAVFMAAIGLRAGERRIVRWLTEAGATGPEKATKLPLTNFARKWQFRRLLNAGAAGETMMQLQYLKVPAYAAYRARRRRRAFIIIPIVLALGVYAFYRSRNP